MSAKVRKFWNLYNYIVVFVIIFAAFLGFLFWGELPDLLRVIGYVVIIGCAIFRAFF